jgi:hypothetical protein
LDVLTGSTDRATLPQIAGARRARFKGESFPDIAASRDPIAFWQLRQWQIRTLTGSPSALNLTAPHRHPPSLVMCSPPQWD